MPTKFTMPMQRSVPGCCRAAVAVALLGIAGAGSAQQAAKDAVLAQGEQLARRQCAACHIVAPDQMSAPIVNRRTPSFNEIAQRPATSIVSLRRFLSKTHWDMQSIPVRMPEKPLTDDQAAAVSRYILSLRK